MNASAVQISDVSIPSALVWVLFHRNWMVNADSYTLIPNVDINNVLTDIATRCHVINREPNAPMDGPSASDKLAEMIAISGTTHLGTLELTPIYELPSRIVNEFLLAYITLAGRAPRGKLVKQVLCLLGDFMDHLLYAEQRDLYYIKNYNEADRDYGNDRGEVKFIVDYSEELDRQDLYEWIDDDCYENCDKYEDCIHAKCTKSAYRSILDEVRFIDWRESLRNI